tara:strand:- start:193 stop:420 length:228 start_codon:yes stop_codon:yes gene_type:complete
MKNILAQYLWIFSITAVILVVAVLTFPKKEKQLEFIEDKIEEVQKQKEILTEKELKLKELAVQKEWEEVDNDNNK